jgi:hypothetical protein
VNPAGEKDKPAGNEIKKGLIYDQRPEKNPPEEM